jgi:hypothetical protein
VRALTRNPAATVLGLIALALGIALAVVLISDDEDTSATAKAPAERTISSPPPALKGERQAKSPSVAGRPAALSRESSGLAPQTAGAPGQPNYYNVTVEGQLAQWNGQARAYLATASFKRAALLVVQPNANFGIFAGGLVENSVGRIAFVTNSEVFQWIRGPAASVWLARLPAASVTVDGPRGVIQAVVGASARAVVLNNFSLGASPRTIIAGRVELQFSGGHIQGTIDLYGGPFIEPGNNFPVDLYHATLSG